MLILLAVGFTLFTDSPHLMITILTVVIIIQIFVIDNLGHKIKNIEVILNHKKGEQK
jgi:uncharacterized membrane-anchored protein YitT (DUF2179 family)